MGVRHWPWHMGEPGLISGITNDPQALPGLTSGHRARNKPGAIVGVGPLLKETTTHDRMQVEHHGLRCWLMPPLRPLGKGASFGAFSSFLFLGLLLVLGIELWASQAG